MPGRVPAGVTEGHVFRPVNRGDQVPGAGAVRKGGLADAAPVRGGRWRARNRAS